MVELKAKLISVGESGIFAIFSALIAWLCVYFDIVLALPAFIGTLFFIWVLPATKQARLKNVLASYMAAFIFGALSYTIFNYIQLILAIEISQINIATLFISIILTATLMVIMGMEHPPAFASLVWWAFAIKETSHYIGLVFGIVTLVAMSALLTLVKKKLGVSGGLGGGLEEGGLGGLGETPSLGSEKDLGDLKF
jgi:hypothetical protein